MKKDFETLTMPQAVTLASIVIHTDEMLHEPNPNSADFDRNTNPCRTRATRVPSRGMAMNPENRDLSRHEVEVVICRYLRRKPQFHWCGDPWCQFNPPTLHLADPAEWGKMEVLQSALHEATHLKLGRGGHDMVFWDALADATREYLCSELTPLQLQMRVDYLAPATTEREAKPSVMSRVVKLLAEQGDDDE